MSRPKKMNIDEETDKILNIPRRELFEMNERRGTKGLELWCRKMTEGYSGVKIDNMTTSWRDGLAFCAIIHHFRPDLLDFSKLNKDDVYHNNELAFRVAEQYLGIPALLEPEDMVEYTVPDRLSILTYLSQFYQAFAVREGASPARIAPKRPQSSPDHGIVSPASTSPPTKVAFTGPSLRREPCTKCGLPVFIAERLNVGKSLFHRTCFRCARCNSQLTIANFYETESNEFCCEICPDEEKEMSKTSVQKAVLQRSMSDEDKTESLKMVSNEPDEFSTMFESALEDADIEKVQTLGREFDSARSDFFRSQIIESSDSGNEDSSNKEESKPPDLPKTEPPKSEVSAPDSVHFDSGFPSKDVSVKSSFSDNVESQNVVTKESVVKTRMRLFENNLKADVHSKKVPLSPNASIPSSIKNVDNRVSESKEEIKHSKSQGFHSDSGENVSSNQETPKKQFTSSISLTLDKESNTDVIHHSSIDNSKENEDFSIISISDSSVDQNMTTTDESMIKDSVISIEDSVENTDESLIKHSVISVDDSVEDRSKIEEAIKVINSTIISLQDTSESSEVFSPEKIYSISSPKENYSLENPEGFKSPNSDDRDISFIDEEDDSKGYISPIETSSYNEIINTTKYNSSQEDKKLSLDESLKEEVAPSENHLVETINYKVKEPKEPKELKPIEAVNDNVKGEINLDHMIVDAVNLKVKNPKLLPSENLKDELKNKTDQRVVETIKYKVTEAEKDLSLPQLQEEIYPDDLNPFDDEVETKKKKESVSSPKTSLNPFGSDDEGGEEILAVPLRKPVPSPRFKKKVIDASDCRKAMESPMKNVNIQRSSINPFECDDDDEDDDKPPVPTTRRKKVSAPRISLNPFSSEDEDENEEGFTKPLPAPRRASSRLSELRHHEGNSLSVVSHNFGGSNSSISSGSCYGSTRKKRPAPKPPIPGFKDGSNNSSLTSTPNHSVPHSPKTTPKYRKEKRAPPPPMLTSTPKHDENINKETPKNPDDLHTEKIVKDELNRNRQNQNLNNNENVNTMSVPNKSTYGKWKRKKGQAPPKPVPPQRRTIKCLPMTEIKKELEFIEIQQQGLEKQGVRIEQIIREKCEGSTGDGSANPDDDIPIEVEDLILQLFELVNEKNELFRKQTELMYLRRQQRLEEEHADVEYQIRCLMMQPEANKTDYDKAREEELIKRLVEIVERRNEIVECLEKDRVREAEEDDSISTHINLFTLSRDSQGEIKSENKPEKSKKEKKKEKEKEKKKEKKSKLKSKDKVDVDKDVDETETSMNTLEKKKKKKFNLF